MGTVVSSDWLNSNDEDEIALDFEKADIAIEECKKLFSNIYESFKVMSSKFKVMIQNNGVQGKFADSARSAIAACNKRAELALQKGTNLSNAISQDTVTLVKQMLDEIKAQQEVLAQMQAANAAAPVDDTPATV